MRRFGGRSRFGGGDRPSREFGGDRGGNRFGDRGGGDVPVKVGEEYDVEIKEMGNKGDGIARVKNFVVFVPNTEKGDKVRIKIKEIRGRSAVGEVVGKGEGEEAGEETEAEQEVTEDMQAGDVAEEEEKEEEEEEEEI